MNNIKFKIQKMSKSADMKLRYKLYIMMLKKYFKNLKNVFKVLTGAISIIVIGIFTIFNFSGDNILAVTSEQVTISTSNIILSKEYRQRRVLAYHNASNKNRINALKIEKYKEISLKRRLVNN